MPKVLKIECIGDDTDQYTKLYRGITNHLFPGLGDLTFGKMPKRYWVAEIKGFCDKFKYTREFLRSKKDYSQANSVGSRGVFAYYILEENKVYEVKSPKTWKHSDRYFCTVIGGEIFELTQEEVDTWLKNNLASMCLLQPENA